MNIPAEPIGARSATWNATVGTTLALQWGLILVLGAVASGLAGVPGGRSLLLGGAAVAVPNTLFAAWLTLRMHRAGPVGAVGMFAGEVFKLGLTMATLVAIVAQWKTQLSWPALIVGVIGALKAQWLALWFTRRL